MLFTLEQVLFQMNNFKAGRKEKKKENSRKGCSYMQKARITRFNFQ